MSRDRERQAIAQVACPTCQAPRGSPCCDVTTRRPITPRGRPYVHPARRHAAQHARQGDALEIADIIMSDHVEGPPGARTWQGVILAPISARGRHALPAGPTKIPQTETRPALARLRQAGMIVRRED